MPTSRSSWGTTAHATSLCCCALALAVVACGAGRMSDDTAPAAPDPPPAARPVVDTDFGRAEFSDPLRIDNSFNPLIPGSQFVLEGRADRGAGRRPHRVVLTVTDLTKVLDGVRTRVLWDRDYNAGRLLEGELAFQAQDDAGNLWSFGEYPEEYERGRFAGAPDAWIAGTQGARAGILMRAAPRTQTSSYLQGWAPRIDFADRARVLATGVRTCVPYACYRGVLVIDEWNPSEPGAHQRKYYAPRVGNIRVGAAGGKEDEVLVLVDAVRLGPRALAAAREEALRLERRAYTVSRETYGSTPPARRDAS
jgi:hypothetical protein